MLGKNTQSVINNNAILSGGNIFQWDITKQTVKLQPRYPIVNAYTLFYLYQLLKISFFNTHMHI